jgi:hypothetical protein
MRCSVPLIAAGSGSTVCPRSVPGIPSESLTVIVRSESLGGVREVSGAAIVALSALAGRVVSASATPATDDVAAPSQAMNVRPARIDDESDTSRSLG